MSPHFRAPSQNIHGGSPSSTSQNRSSNTYVLAHSLSNCILTIGKYNALKDSGCSNVNCLRSLPTARLELLNQQVQNSSYPGPGVGYGVYNFGPVVDYKFIRELPSLAFQRGNFYDVPLMVDHDAYEGDIFSNMSQKTQVQETTDAKDLFPFAGRAFFSRLYQLYPRSTYNSTFFQRQSW